MLEGLSIAAVELLKPKVKKMPNVKSVTLKKANLSVSISLRKLKYLKSKLPFSSKNLGPDQIADKIDMQLSNALFLIHFIKFPLLGVKS